MFRRVENGDITKTQQNKQIKPLTKTCAPQGRPGHRLRAPWPTWILFSWSRADLVCAPWPTCTVFSCYSILCSKADLDFIFVVQGRPGIRLQTWTLFSCSRADLDTVFILQAPPGLRFRLPGPTFKLCGFASRKHVDLSPAPVWCVPVNTLCGNCCPQIPAQSKRRQRSRTCCSVHEPFTNNMFTNAVHEHDEQRSPCRSRTFRSRAFTNSSSAFVHEQAVHEQPNTVQGSPRD